MRGLSGYIMEQKRLIICPLYLLTCILISLFFYPSYTYGVEAISVGMSLPQFVLEASDTIEAKQYLGVKNPKSFPISQISAKIILIEVFSFYCPICHKQAPIVNRIYKFIQQNPELSTDIKIIGIGAGNNQKEIEIYRAKYKTPFPLFSDPNFKIHKKIGEPRTPFTILVDNKGKVLLTHFGVVENAEEFFSKIKNIHKQIQ